MSIETMVWVLQHAPVSGTEKVILLGLANHADPEGRNAWPSVATLARYANVTPRRVQQALRKLEESGHIRVIPNAGGSQVVRDDRRPNLYEILTDEVKRSSPRLFDGVKPVTPRGEVGFANGVKPASPEPSIEPSKNTLAPAARKRDELWDAAVDIFYGGRTEFTDLERGRLNRALKSMRDVGATPDEMRARAAEYRKRWPEVELTALALASNWSIVEPKRRRVVDACTTCGQGAIAHDDDICRALAGGGL